MSAFGHTQTVKSKICNMQHAIDEAFGKFPSIILYDISKLASGIHINMPAGKRCCARGLHHHSTRGERDKAIQINVTEKSNRWMILL